MTVRFPDSTSPKIRWCGALGAALLAAGCLKAPVPHVAAVPPAAPPPRAAPAAAAPGAALPGRVFYASFDGKLDAVDARGAGQAEVVGKPTFAEGKRGQGIMVGDIDGGASVNYQSQGLVNLERGTVALWVQSVNWEGKDGAHQLFFRAKIGEKGTFLVYKYHNPAWGLTFYVDPDEGPRGKLYCYQPVPEWRPGQWRHIACTWTRGEAMVLYVDGEPAKRLEGAPLPDKPVASTITFGGDWQRKGCRSVIDEAMIFDRMLAPHEIAQLAGKGGEPPSSVGPRDVPGVLLAHAILGQRVLARVYPDALGLPVADAARLTLSPAGKTEISASRTAELAPGLNKLDLDLTSIPRGRYEARLALLAGGVVRAVEALVVRKESDDTLEDAAKIGREDVVLPPFGPVKAAGNSVECCGPKYEFGGSGLPAQVRAQGASLLAAPVRVAATSADGPLAFAPTGLTVTETSPTQVGLSGGLRAAALQVAAQVTVRYDGTVWTSLRFAPEGAVELTKLNVEIPLVPEHAKFLAFIGLARVDEKRLGYDALPAGEGVVWRREFLPSLWIGSEDRGLGWYAESDQHWDVDGEESLTIERNGQDVTLRLNVIRAARRVTEPFVIEFGLQGSPIRPLAPDWRAQQWAPSADTTRFFLDLRKRPYAGRGLGDDRPQGQVCYLYAYHPHFTSTLPKDPDEFREMTARVKSFGLTGIPYTDINCIPANQGDVLLTGGEMHTTPVARLCGYGAYCNITTCHKGRFSDWYVWYVTHLAREYGANGIYIDEVWMYGCADASHGCGYVGPDGKRRLTYALRARNETLRRLRAMFAATGEPFHIGYHISGGRLPPLATFADSLLLGEDRYYTVKTTPDYTENMTPEQWRAGYLTPAWGVPNVIIPQFKMRGDWMKSEDLAEEFLAAVVPHDLMIWACFIEWKTVMRCRAALDDFGIGAADTRFLPYWRTNPGLSCGDARVKLSAYLRPGKLLLCAANWSDEDIEKLEIDVDPAGLGLAAAAPTARDALTGDALGLAAKQVVARLPAKRLRLIEVK